MAVGCVWKYDCFVEYAVGDYEDCVHLSEMGKMAAEGQAGFPYYESLADAPEQGSQRNVHPKQLGKCL